ncbi:aminoglycoside phosphotransferase family protein [Streptomyces sp. NPDC051940]|uniref:aminoglycoside phosphotransferase family protein n=1 Tax=Streptomyces sp. NPDC051940 TaxID=3155675 RepID=UPI003424E8CA
MTSAFPPVPLDPPERLVRSVGARGDTAERQWLAGLPALVRRYAAAWRLVPERVLTPGGSRSMLVHVRTPDDTPAALKLVPAGEPAAGEAAALERWNGLGAVRLLRAEPADGVLLLERLRGAVSLRSLAEGKAMLEAAATLQRLWVDPGDGHRFTTVAAYTGERAARLRADGAAVPEAAALVDEALRARERLADSADHEVLLHGDYHQGQVLAGDRTPWLAVGPRPLAGERAYDLARLVRDRLDTLAASPGAAATARRRVTRLADSLDVDADRLRDWSRFRAVASGVAAVERGDRRGGELLLEYAGWL